jgi:hypothetical protein
MEFVKFNEPLVEINADRKPRLTGGRRGANTLMPGGTNVTDNLVPVSQLPASAGALDAVFNNLKKRKPRKNGGAIVANKDGTYTPVGSDSMTFKDDPNHWSRMPRHGGAYLGTDGKVHTSNKGLGSARGGKMSKLIPEHGHGANTQIGTNYKLAQFGGSMTQPIGNTASTLSPALSTGSIGAGRKSKSSPIKGKNLKSLIALMVTGRNHCCGGGMKEDALNLVKKISIGLYHEFGPQIFEVGKDVLLKALEKGAKEYITGGKMTGGLSAKQFWNGVVSNVEAYGSILWNRISAVLNSAIVKEIQKQVIAIGIDAAKQYALGALSSNAPIPADVAVGAGMPNPIAFKKLTPAQIKAQEKAILKGGVVSSIPVKRPQLTPAQMKAQEIDMLKHPEKYTHQNNIPNNNFTMASGGKKPSARGAIVKKIMKEKNLSLPMASKYVKEHGLY